MVIKKLQKSGNSYSVYLPVDWARKINGKEVKLEVTPLGILEISPVGLEKEVSLKKDLVVKSLDVDFVIRNVAALYVDGYDEFRILFEKGLENKTRSKLNKELINRGLSQYIIDFDEREISFKIPPGFLPPEDLWELILQRVKKAILSIEYGEHSDAKEYRREYIFNMLIFQRMYTSLLRKPFLISGFKFSSSEVFDMLQILYSAKEMADWIVKEKVDVNDIKQSVNVMDMLMKFIKKKDFGLAQEISAVKKKIEDKVLFLQVKIIERTLLNWSLL